MAHHFRGFRYKIGFPSLNIKNLFFCLFLGIFYSPVLNLTFYIAFSFSNILLYAFSIANFFLLLEIEI